MDFLLSYVAVQTMLTNYADPQGIADGLCEQREWATENLLYRRKF